MVSVKNEQPFYHRVVVLFTAIEEVSEEDLLDMLRGRLEGYATIIEGTVDIEEMDCEPGDPADLM